MQRSVRAVFCFRRHQRIPKDVLFSEAYTLVVNHERLILFRRAGSGDAQGVSCGLSEAGNLEALPLQRMPLHLGNGGPAPPSSKVIPSGSRPKVALLTSYGLWKGGDVRVQWKS